MGLVAGVTRAASPYVYHSCEKRIKRAAPRSNPCNRAILCVNLADDPYLVTVRPESASTNPSAAMSDRKYRQRGYQDDDRDRQPKAAGTAAGARTRRPGRRAPNLAGWPAQHQHAGLPRGRPLLAVRHRRRRRRSRSTARCLRCGTDLHSCSQCTSFDPGSRFECMETTVTARVSPKNTRNTCTLYAARTTVERETTTPEGRQRAQGVRRSLQALARAARANRRASCHCSPNQDRQTVRDPPGSDHPSRRPCCSSPRHSVRPRRADQRKQVLDEVAALNDLISVEEVNLILDKERAAQFGVDRIPAIALLRDDEDTRIRFLGRPGRLRVHVAGRSGRAGRAPGNRD